MSREYADQIADDLGREDERSLLEILRDWAGETKTSREDKLIEALTFANVHLDPKWREQVAGILLEYEPSITHRI